MDKYHSGIIQALSIPICLEGERDYEHTTETNWVTFPWVNDKPEKQLEGNKNQYE